MNRLLLHLTFWLLYLVQDTFLHFTWMGPLLTRLPENEQFLLALQTALAVLPPKLLIVYYFINFGVRKLLSDQGKRVFHIAEMAFFLAISVLMFRLTFHYLVNPRIYLVDSGAPLFNAMNILISILEIGYITGIAVAFKLLKLQTSSKEREQSLIKEKLETELKFLRNQTNPHFLFNTLNSIYALSRKKSDKTPDAVMKLSELLSFMLYQAGKPTITIGEEIEVLEDYIDLEKLRYNERLTIRINKNIDDSSRSISPLLLLPLVENAFKHGVSEARFNSFINIEIILSKAHLRFSIENTMEDHRKENGDSCIGLKNIQRQLELMYNEHELIIHEGEKVFSVMINLNLDSYGKI